MATALSGSTRALDALIARIGKMTSAGVQRDLTARAANAMRAAKGGPPVQARSSPLRRARRFGRTRQSDASRRAFSTLLRKVAAQAFSFLQPR